MSFFLGFIFSSYAELTFVTVPQGIELSEEKPAISHGEISSIINYLMGIPLSNDISWKGMQGSL